MSFDMLFYPLIVTIAASEALCIVRRLDPFQKKVYYRTSHGVRYQNCFSSGNSLVLFDPVAQPCEEGIPDLQIMAVYVEYQIEVFRPCTES